MIETHIRHHYQRFMVDPVAVIFVRYFTANQVTIVSLAAGIISAICIGSGSSSLAFLFLLLSGYLDTLDGTMARMSGKANPFGAILDITCDRLVEWCIIIGLFMLDPVGRGLLCLFMLGTILLVITSFLSAGIFIKNDSNKSFNYTPGLMERPEAFVFFSLMIFFPGWFTYLVYIFCALVIYTALLRLWQAKKILMSEESN